MKVAFSPEMAVRVGSASVRITPARSMARSVEVMDLKVPDDGAVAERLADRRKWIAGVQVDDRRAEGKRAIHVDTELLDDVALDLGHGDLEHHLIATAHDDGVHDLAALRRDRRGVHAQQPRGDVEGLLRLGLARRRPAQDDPIIADAVDSDVGVGQQLLDARPACR